MARLSAYVASRNIPCKIVFGMSAATWRYQGAHATRFDKQVTLSLMYHLRICESFPMAACLRVTGEYELEKEILDSELKDGIGHLQGFGAGRKLVYAINRWVRDVPDLSLHLSRL